MGKHSVGGLPLGSWPCKICKSQEETRKRRGSATSNFVLHACGQSGTTVPRFAHVCPFGAPKDAQGLVWQCTLTPTRFFLKIQLTCLFTTHTHMSMQRISSKNTGIARFPTFWDGFPQSHSESSKKSILIWQAKPGYFVERQQKGWHKFTFICPVKQYHIIYPLVI